MPGVEVFCIIRAQQLKLTRHFVRIKAERMEQLAVEKNELAAWVLSIQNPEWLRRLQAVREEIAGDRRGREQDVATALQSDVEDEFASQGIQGVEIKKELDIDAIALAQGNPRLTEEKLKAASEILDIQGTLDEILDQLK